ncbi:MAG TPA: hypothetical protein VJI52_05655 [Candidatus Nanoarchaeia archaeon]|nr:hypothetical protein [Candidatus Nanoarchaeia archaeon]
MFRKFLTWVVKNLIVLLLVAGIFYAASFNLSGMAQGGVKDIFQYASPESQKEIVSKLTLVCSSLDGKDVSGLQRQLSSGIISIDFSKIGALCKDYNSEKINDKEFFSGVVGTAIPDKLGLPKVQALDKYYSAIDFLNKNKMYYFIALLALLAVLFLLAGNLHDFLVILTGISFSMGILILLPYAAIAAYSKLVGFDTTPILSSILQGSFSLDIKAIISVVLLMVLRTYTVFILALGAVFLSVGIAGKVHNFRLKRKNKTPDTGKKETKGKLKEEKNEKESKDEKPDKNKKDVKEEKIKKSNKEKKSKEEVDEEYEHRDRTYKEVLDELDEMHERRRKEKKD